MTTDPLSEKPFMKEGEESGVPFSFTLLDLRDE